ncbi:MAG: response regulator [Bacteroidota bacterium]|nr:response regulator [Bacteroidota bacterium]
MEDRYIDILLVEDNPYEAQLTIAGLEEHNLARNLLHINDGAEALDFIFSKGQYSRKNGRNEPKIILLDLNLPKIGGLEVLRQIKADEQTRSIPVIILSSSKEDVDVICGYHHGVNSYIVKPVEFNLFNKAIADLGMYWMLLNQSSIGRCG